jgi:hypothetical protein
MTDPQGQHETDFGDLPDRLRELGGRMNCLRHPGPAWRKPRPLMLRAHILAPLAAAAVLLIAIGVAWLCSARPEPTITAGRQPADKPRGGVAAQPQPRPVLDIGVAARLRMQSRSPSPAGVRMPPASLSMPCAVGGLKWRVPKPSEMPVTQERSVNHGA